MPRVDGLATKKRRVLVAAAMSGLLYGAEIWAKSLSTYKTGRDKIRKAQRSSGIAAFLIAGMLPENLLAEERREIYRDQTNEKEAREMTRQKWMVEVHNHRGGEWTKKLIKVPLKGMDRNHCDLEYETIQFLSGDGCFETHRKKKGRATAPNAEIAKDWTSQIIFSSARNGRKQEKN
ncbi:uncharacterized protein LOC123322203 [Coccinella septempunctata]|uniref:uncharacterized protein LOC123322203 n=1 Tax=Coccinella septempunctata TaxID=41139 RepID=UPI001D08B528|nr:uncharacterized protein LOC123322203 [Coccinella septempunctata]